MTTSRICTSLALVLMLGCSLAADTLLFDFGRTDLQTNPGWNNVVPATGTLFATFDSNNNLTPIGFEITDLFFQTGEPSQLGTEMPTGDAAAYPVSATDDYFFGHTTPFAGADPNPLGQFKLFNLDPALTYDFTFFASRTGVSDTRDATYAVTGTSSASVVLNASNNNSDVVRVMGIAPDSNNEIFVDVTPGPNNDNSNGFYYIGLMQVDFVPEPSSLGLLLGGALLWLASYRRGRSLA